MKQLLKRLTATVLMLCTLASFLVPATRVDADVSEGRVVATYDIWLYDASLGANEGYNTLFPKGNTRHINLANLKTDIDALYNATEGTTLNWAYVASANESNLQYRTSSMLLRLRGGANNWAALKIKVPESGNFALTYGVDNTVAANNGSITAWVFPASGQEDAATIPDLMTDTNCVGTKDMTGSDKITFEPMSFTEGEYIVVYQGSINDIWLGELGLVDTGTVSETTETTTEPDGSASDTQVAITYDIWLYDKNLGNDEGYNSLMGYSDAGGLLHTKLADIAPQIETLYNATEGLTLNWAYVASANETNLVYRTPNMLLRLRGGANNWAALKIKVPEGGNLALTYGVDNTVAANNGSITAWVFPVSSLEAAQGATAAEKIPNLMTDDNCVGTKDMTGSSKITFDAKDYVAGEYIVVYQGSINDIWLGELGLVETKEGSNETDPTDSSAPDETTLPDTVACGGTYTDGIYNFALYTEDSRAPMFTTGDGLVDVKYDSNCCTCGKTFVECIAAQYAAGNLNWTLEGMTFGEARILAGSYRENGYGGVYFRYDTDENGEIIKVTQTSGLKHTSLPNIASKIETLYNATEGLTLNWAYVASGNPSNLVYRSPNMLLRLRGGASNWAALKIKVPESGKFALTYGVDASIAANNGSITAWVFPATAADSASSIPSLMTDANCVGTKDMTGSSKITFNAKDYVAGEYIVVYQGSINDIWLGELGLVKAADGATVSTYDIWLYDASKANDEGYNALMSYTASEKIQETDGNWLAYRVKVANPGTYTVTVNKDYPVSYSADMYVFPAPAEKMTRSQLDAALTDSNKVGNIEFSEAMVSSEAGDYTFKNAGEYIIAIKTTRGTTRPYLNTVTLTEPMEDQPIPAVNEKIYNFDLSTDDSAFLNKPINGRYNADGSVRIYQAVNQMYGEGQIPWNYETKADAMALSVISFRTGCLRLKSPENFRDLESQWVAFRIKNPGTATYDIRLESSTASRMYANIYLIPLDTVLTMSPDEVKAEMTEENRFLQNAIFDDKGTFYLGEYTFGTETEYLLVVEPTKGTLLHISNLRMTLDGTVADGTVKKEKYINGTVYDFDVNDALNGWFTDSKIHMPVIINELNAMWRNGTLKWRWETACDSMLSEGGGSDLVRFYKNVGMRIYNKKDYWTAYRIKSPGSGEFTLTFNHALMNSSGTIAVYILPGDTEDVEFAMDPKNRVGKVTMYNDGSTTVQDGSTSFIGYWEFEAGKEYIVVFEAYDESPFVAGNCYVNISQMVAERGRIEYTTTEDKTVGPVTVAKNVVPVADPLYNNLVTEIYGHDYFFLPVEGGSCLVYDLDTGELVDEIPVGFSRTMDVRMDKDGMVWFSGAGKYLVRYDPYTQETFKTPTFLDTPGLVGTGANSICPTPDGKIWFATYYDGVFGYYDYQTNEYTIWDQVMDTPRYTVGMTYHNGYLYMAANNDAKAQIIKFDTQTLQIVGTTDVTHMMGTASYLNNLSMLGDGDYLVAGINGNKTEGFICVDPKTMELYEDHGMFGGMGMGATEIIDGKQYLVCSGYGLYEYDVATKTFSKTPGFGNEGIGFRSKDGSLISLNGEKVLFTYTTSGGHPRMYNLDTKEYKTWDDLVRHGSGGAEIHGVINGADDGKLYIGAYNTPQYGIYDEALGKITGYVKTGGQGDSGIWYNGKFYTGNYSSTTLNEIPVEEASPEFPATNEIIQRLQLNHEETGQKRIHSLAAGDGKVFVGSIPDTGVYGGAVAVYDTKTGRWFYDRSPAGDLAVTKVVYSDKLLWGATSTAPGTGTTTEKPEGSSAMIFAYDYENRQAVAQLDIRKHISGLPKEIDFIAGFEKDPVVENRFWGVVSETLFCFTYDKENKTFNVQEVLSFDKTVCDSTAGRQLWSRPILFDTTRNSIYFSFDTNGGFRCVEIADWNAQIGNVKVKANARIMGDTPKWYAMGQDGNIYYGKGADLLMLPLNITDEDWEIAGAVDKMITDLGEIALESEAAIKSARSAYDNLSWRYRTLIKELELLQESETDLLECKIDTIAIEEVDADSLPGLQELMDVYNGFNTRQQKYTKNYSHLLEAHTKASKLNDERVAAALQKRIDALDEKFPLTLDDEPEVKEIRADYDAMSGSQRNLMDITILEDAEAQIKVLRAEFVVYVEELIQKIPAQITLDAEEVIVTAREAADKLYVNERKQVSYAKLTSAEGKLRKLLSAKAAAEEVDALIKEIGIVTLGDKSRIAEARDAYDSLNDTALTFLTGEKKLLRAEFILKALQTWGIPVIAVVDAGIVFAVLWFVPSLRKKVFKTKKKEDEVIDN